MEENVTWRDVMNFNGVFAEAYHANSLGEVWSKDRWITYKSKKGVEFRYFKKGRKLSPGITRGYPQINLKCNGKKEHLFVHQVIAVCFPEICGTWFPGAEVDHKDGNRQNNRPENLWLVTRKQNMNNKITKKRMSVARKGTRLSLATKEKISKSKINHPAFSKPVFQFTMNGVFVSEYPSASEAARQTGIPQANISKVLLGKREHCGGYKFYYNKNQ